MSQIPQMAKVVFLLYFKFDEYMHEIACAIRTNNCSIKTAAVTIFNPPVPRIATPKILFLLQNNSLLGWEYSFHLLKQCY